MKSLYLYSLCAYYFLTACNANNTKGVTNKDSVKAVPVQQGVEKRNEYFEPGKIIPKISCLTDTSLSFALYLPKSYSSTDKLPVLYLFDPEGAGAFPLNIYKDLADKYSYILIGSNNSKNGLQPDKYNYITQTLLNDTKDRFGINEKRLYTGGLSGGARVAVSVALENPAIVGVAGCGAGFPNMNKQIDPTFLYISFAGNQDFNLTELKNLDTQLNTIAIRHFLIEFSGKHKWSPPKVYENAFYAFEFNAMQKALSPKNDPLIRRFIHENDSLLKFYKSKNQYYEIYNLYKKMIFFLGQLVDVKNYYTELIDLQNSKELKDIFEEKRVLEIEELKLQEDYTRAFSQKDPAWWNTEIEKMNNQPDNTEKGLMYKRVKSYLGLIVYMQSASALTQNDTKAAKRFLTIYKLLEPKNSEQAYLFATFYAKKGETKDALTALQEAEKLGFNNVKRLVSDVSFKDLQQNNTFKEIVSQLYSKQ